LWLAWVAGVAVGYAATPAAAPYIDTVRVDFETLIRAAASSEAQFALSVPHLVSTSTAGGWSADRGVAIWRYAVRIPTAVSMSFHASRAVLPEGATLTVSGGTRSMTYRGSDLRHGEIWSRVLAGEMLDFTLEVPAADRAHAALSIASFQAGYRSLGAGVKDHPVYARIKALNAAVTNASCVQNYECSISAGNTPPGQATMGLLIDNLYQCTGTLINDVPGDNAPYVLTARHCQTGKLGGGNPGAASAVTAVWNAVVACGQTLGSLYDPGLPAQFGATTVVEQQDAWLIRLDSSPVVTDAQFAGFDASGGPVTGGYTIHHALGSDKQFVGWFGTAFASQQSDALGTKYVSNFLEVVNRLGNIGPGASGSALFDQNDRLVGALSLGRKTADSSGYQSCPISPGPPNISNSVADFTALSSVWDSTADTTSSTGAVTLKSALDPGNTGTLVMRSAPAALISFTASSYSLAVGQSVQLSWSTTPAATQCTASGGESGDGWGGTVAAASTQTLTADVSGAATYSLSCRISGGRDVSASVTISWSPPAPQLSANAQPAVWTTRPAELNWTSNVQPCSISGGSLNLTNLASSGSATTTQDTPGDVTYTIQCGPPGDSALQPVTVSFVTPSMVFSANGTDRLLGQTFFLTWHSYADSCTPSGGAPNDGWSTNAYPAPSGNPSFNPVVAAAGSYTYTLTCSSGPISLTKDIAVTFENNPPFVTVSVDRTSYQYSASAADGFTLSWNSNYSRCSPQTDPVRGAFITTNLPQDSGKVQLMPGTYALSVSCSSSAGADSVASAPISVKVLPPPAPVVNITLSPAKITVGDSFSVVWSATNSSGCVGDGGIPSQLWAPDGMSGSTSGSLNFNSSTAGQFTFGLTCHSIDTAQPDVRAQATLIVDPVPPPPTASLSASVSSIVKGQSFTLKWSSANATGCTASGGPASTVWSGAQATSGSLTESANTVGTFTYTLTCDSATQSAAAQTSVTVTAPPSGGGGGSFDSESLAAMLALASACLWIGGRKS
jgi:hypothetical protein